MKTRSRGVVALLMIAPCAAFAQDAAPEDAGAASPGGPEQVPDVTPPKLLSDPGVAYPQQALDEKLADVTVTLILTLDATGAVTDVTLETPRGHGFDEAAIQAGQKLVFQPARRGDRPIPSRIRFHYDFKAPSPRLVGHIMRRAEGSPIAGAAVAATDRAGIEHRTATAIDGSFRIEGLAPGRVHVVVTASGEQSFTSDEELIPGEETELVFRLTPVATPARVDAGIAGPVEEVIIRGERPPREVTKRTMKRDEIARIPGTNGDALRSLQNMPGVARSAPFNGGLIVRGSPPLDTNIFVDGTNIPLVYHFGAFSSVVPTEVLEKIDFFPGNYSSVYGRGMGGIVDVNLRDPKKDALHGIAQVDLIDTRLLLEGPIGNTGWSFLAAGRRSWFDVWLTPLLKNAGVGVTTAPRYYDYQAALQKDFGTRQSFRLLFFGSDDSLAIVNPTPGAADPTLGGGISARTSFWRVQARYENKITSDTSLRATAAYGQDTLDVALASRFQRATAHPLSGRLELSQKSGSAVTANVGLDLMYEPYDLNVRRSPPRRPGQPDLGATDTPIETANSGVLFLPGAYTELELRPFRGTRIVPGLRADYDSGTSSWDFSPRISARQDLTTGFPRTTLKGGAGLFYQPPTPFETDARYGQTGLYSSRSVHYDIGFEQEITTQVDVSLDTFYKKYDRLVVPGGGNSGTGQAYGGEVLLRYKADDHFFGWLSYTLSRSERRDLPGEPLRLFRYDQTHILTAIASYKLPRGWQVGARFRLISGPLATTSSYGAFDATAGAQNSADSYPPYGQRLPLFHQLDLRVDKVWTFARWKLSAYLDVQNVTNSQAVEGLSYNYNFTQSNYTKGLPILPSLGLRAEF